MSSSTTPTAFSPDHLSSSEQLCYVHCNFCDTILAVSVPCTSLFKTVTVRCGHCTNLLSVNVRGLLVPPPNQFHHLGHPFFTPQNFLEEIRNVPPNMLMINQPNQAEQSVMPVRGVDLQEIPKLPVVNRPPEKRQRVPSAYNRFIKDEIQRIKAGNPDISHREAFSAAAKNWAHFPHIHFGLLPSDQPVKKTSMRQEEGEDVMTKDGFFTSTKCGCHSLLRRCDNIARVSFVVRLFFYVFCLTVVREAVLRFLLRRLLRIWVAWPLLAVNYAVGEDFESII